MISEYHKAREKLKKREQHENALAKALARESLERFREYLKMEVREGDPARVQCLYERAVTQHCLDVDLWQVRARCTLHTARCTLHAARCTLHATHYTLHSAHCRSTWDTWRST